MYDKHFAIEKNKIFKNNLTIFLDDFTWVKKKIIQRMHSMKKMVIIFIVFFLVYEIVW